MPNWFFKNLRCIQSLERKKYLIIAGCNGAGKTTTSFTILPEILDCKEFVNLERIEVLLKSNENFAFETTLSTKSYKQKIIWAK